MNSLNWANTPPQAILFDMDGVLVDSETAHWESVRTVLREQGILDKDHPLPMTGWSDRLIWPTLRQSLPLKDSDTTLIQRRAVPIESALRDHPPPLLPKVWEVLQFLHNRVPLVVVSASARSQINLSITQFHSMFADTISGHDECLENKPSPMPYFNAAQRINVPIESCWIFEDSSTGLEAALATGATVISINASSVNDELLYRCVSNWSDLSPILTLPCWKNT